MAHRPFVCPDEQAAGERPARLLKQTAISVAEINNK
jgi:hypothetical protein